MNYIKDCYKARFTHLQISFLYRFSVEVDSIYFTRASGVLQYCSLFDLSSNGSMQVVPAPEPLLNMWRSCTMLDYTMSKIKNL